uniref:Uncharacterized protein n=1 Tax=Saccharum hybrid cultivar R570 TaxID=131158 RepID=A0A059Q380_9POAL|nr:hypothetical protein SHCRBa_116_M17_R_30 [Saccharum hybrid cultivar R570]
MLHSSPAQSWKIIFLLLNLNLHYSRARRKRLNVSSDGHDDTSHGRSSDEQTLQVLKSRTKNKKVPLVDSSLSAPQHQEAQHDPDSDDATIGSMIRNVQNHQESSDNTNTKDCSPTISQHERTLLDTYPDDETIGSIFRSGKKKRLVTSNFSANIEDEESLRNINLHDETVASNITDASVKHGSDPVDDSGNTVEAELLDDFEVELDNHENNH